MARLMGYFVRGESRPLTVLVATSGDTGSAVAHGFLGVPGIRVVILYPSRRISEAQEKQFTTLGENITALEVAGTLFGCHPPGEEGGFQVGDGGGNTLQPRPAPHPYPALACA